MRELLISSAVLISAVALLRRLLRGRISPRLQYALWLPVLLRLALPIPLLPSPVSAVGAAEQLVQTAVRTAEPAAYTAPTVLTETVSAVVTEAGASLPIHWAAYVWLFGAVMAGIWFSAAGLHLARRLRRTRRQLPCAAPVPVYVTDVLTSPCLFGLFRPAVYLTEQAAADPALAEIAAAHELTHLRHRDNLWAALRVLSLIAYWFDPFVWLAVLLSRQDAELFCDADAVRNLGESRRFEYGRALLALSEVRPQPAERLCGAAMAGGAGRMWDRITRIARKQRYSVPIAAAAVLIVAAVVIVTFTRPAGTLPAETPIPASPAAQADTVPDETAPSAALPDREPSDDLPPQTARPADPAALTTAAAEETPSDSSLPPAQPSQAPAVSTASPSAPAVTPEPAQAPATEPASEPTPEPAPEPTPPPAEEGYFHYSDGYITGSYTAGFVEVRINGQGAGAGIGTVNIKYAAPDPGTYEVVVYADGSASYQQTITVP